ncbi:MAG: hypothetical protein OEY11_07005 [Gammaproteobacteria bacterium]|nr:hypothetical protein [Gammaproteobacteria bacterium]
MKNNTCKIRYPALSLVLLFGLNGCSMFSKIDTKNIGQTLPDRPSKLTAVTDSSARIGRTVIRYKEPVNPEKKSKRSILKRLQQGFDRELGKQSGRVVDRKLNKSVGNEIELAEIYGKQSGRQDADYIMMIALDDYHSSKSVVDEKSPFDRKQFSTCYYEASYRGWIRILSIPSLEKIAQWEIEEGNSGSFKENSAKRCRKAFKSHLQTSQRKMISETLCRSENEYLNALSPSGHILSIKRDKDDILLESSLGSRHNAKKGDKIFFYHELDSAHYAEGTIVSLSSKNSWIKLQSLDAKETLYRHDWVRPHYSGIMDMMKCLF